MRPPPLYPVLYLISYTYDVSQGVGKSSVAAQLALALYASAPDARVGVLDADLTGPSVPRMLAAPTAPVHQSTDGWVPVFVDGPSARLACMSVGFLLKRREDSVVWRGPKKNAMIRQFLSDVRWGALDYLVIDTPPGKLSCYPTHMYAHTHTPLIGTSDEHLSLMEHLAPLQSTHRLSSILVTTPQTVALADAQKCLSFTRTVSLPVLGLIENMSGYVCPCCGEVSYVFSTGGGEALAEQEGLRFLGGLPVDTELVTLLDAAEGAEGRLEGEGEGENGHINGANGEAATFPLLQKYMKTSSWPLFKEIVKKALESLPSAEANT